MIEIVANDFLTSIGSGLRTKAEFIDLAGRRTQTEPAAARIRAAFFTFPGPVVCVRKPNSLALGAGVRKPSRQQLGPGPSFSLFQARWFAYKNRIHWLWGQAYANRAGSSSVPGHLFHFFRPDGLRTKTEFIDLAGERTQTDPAPAGAFVGAMKLKELQPTISRLQLF